MCSDSIGITEETESETWSILGFLHTIYLTNIHVNDLVSEVSLNPTLQPSHFDDDMMMLYQSNTLLPMT